MSDTPTWATPEPKGGPLVHQARKHTDVWPGLFNLEYALTACDDYVPTKDSTFNPAGVTCPACKLRKPKGETDGVHDRK